jgi:hypothetical protein
MVVSEKVVKAQVLDRSADSPNSARIASKLVLRVNNADLHGLQSGGLARSAELGLPVSPTKPRLATANRCS